MLKYKISSTKKTCFLLKMMYLLKKSIGNKTVESFFMKYNYIYNVLTNIFFYFYNQLILRNLFYVQIFQQYFKLICIYVIVYIILIQILKYIKKYFLFRVYVYRLFKI